MILEATHINKEKEKEIDNLVGKAFGFIKSIKLGGIGSRRMILKDCSEKIKERLYTFRDIKYVSLELRPSGILVHFNQSFRNYIWVIPYYKLVVYLADGFSVHADGNFLSVDNNNMLRDNKSFIRKMMLQKQHYLKANNFNL